MKNVILSPFNYHTHSHQLEHGSPTPEETTYHFVLIARLRTTYISLYRK